MGIDWGEYYGTEDPDEMMMAIEGEAREASCCDDEPYDNEPTIEDALSRFIASQSTDKVLYIAGHIDSFIDWSLAYALNEKYNEEKKKGHYHPDPQSKMYILAIEHHADGRLFSEHNIGAGGLFEDCNGLWCLSTSGIPADNVYISEIDMKDMSRRGLDCDIPNLSKYKEWEHLKQFSGKDLYIMSYSSYRHEDNAAFLEDYFNDYAKSLLNEMLE